MHAGITSAVKYSINQRSCRIMDNLIKGLVLQIGRKINFEILSYKVVKCPQVS